MVAPEFQGAGLGTALQARLQEHAMSRNVRGFVFEILARNKKNAAARCTRTRHYHDHAGRGCCACDRPVH
jgi:GNAT superfamily N-acetyltransferase